MEIDKKMQWKLINATVPKMKEKPKSLNTQRKKRPLIKLRDS